MENTYCINLDQFDMSKILLSVQNMNAAKNFNHAFSRYFQTRKQERDSMMIKETFSALQDLDQEAMAAGEPSFFLTKIGKEDLDRMESVLQVLVWQTQADLLYLKNLKREKALSDPDSDESDDHVDYGRVWKKVYVSLKAQGIL